MDSCVTAQYLFLSMVILFSFYVGLKLYFSLWLPSLVNKPFIIIIIIIIIIITPGAECPSCHEVHGQVKEGQVKYVDRGRFWTRLCLVEGEAVAARPVPVKH